MVKMIETKTILEMECQDNGFVESVKKLRPDARFISVAGRMATQDNTFLEAEVTVDVHSMEMRIQIIEKTRDISTPEIR